MPVLNDQRGAAMVKKVCAYLSASQDDLSGNEDEEHDFWFDHTVDQTRE